MDANEFNETVKAMQFFCSAEQTHLRLAKRYTGCAQSDVKAIRIQMDTPAPDGDFEILFCVSKDVDKQIGRLSPADLSQILDFTEGLRQAQLPNCSGGAYAYDEGLTIKAIIEGTLSAPAFDPQ
jgi:hypothetical protein